MPLVTTNLLVDFDVHAAGDANDADIDVIQDVSGNNHDATSVVSHKPVNKTGGPNGYNYARFSGSQIAKTTDIDVLPSGGAQRTVFIVTRSLTDPPVSDHNIVQYGPNGSGGQYWSMGTNAGSYQGYFWSLITSTFDPGVMTDWHIIAMQINSSGNPRWWIDGVGQSVDTGVFPNTGSGTVLSIGGNGGAGNGDFRGDILRIIGHGALTDGEIGDQFVYLNNYYFEDPVTERPRSSVSVLMG